MTKSRQHEKKGSFSKNSKEIIIVFTGLRNKLASERQGTSYFFILDRCPVLICEMGIAM